MTEIPGTVTRVVLVHPDGFTEKWAESWDVHVQDDGRTLKLFPRNPTEAVEPGWKSVVVPAGVLEEVVGKMVEREPEEGFREGHWLSLPIVEKLKAQGLSQSEIARQTGYTRSYISWIVNTYGGSLTERRRVLRGVLAVRGAGGDE